MLQYLLDSSHCVLRLSRPYMAYAAHDHLTSTLYSSYLTGVSLRASSELSLSHMCALSSILYLKLPDRTRLKVYKIREIRIKAGIWSSPTPIQYGWSQSLSYHSTGINLHPWFGNFKILDCRSGLRVSGGLILAPLDQCLLSSFEKKH